MNETIRNYLHSGLSVIPVMQDKRPKISWAEFQGRIPGENDADEWGLPIAVVAGKVSGGLMCLDFDDAGSAFRAWAETIKAVDAALPDKLVVQRTPSGGYHVVYRTDDVFENRKLAVRYSEGRPHVLIETRGEGGYFLVAPSQGYKLLRGSFERVQKLNADESNALITAAVLLSEPEREIEPPREVSAPMTRAGTSPFDDYDSRADVVALLCSHGWKVDSTRSDKVCLCRPGKERGLSATWNHVPNRLYVFSTNTEFRSGAIYKPSAVYATIEHRGDFVAAAKELIKKGYGKKDEQPQPPVDYDQSPETVIVKMGDYRDRIYNFYASNRERGKPINLASFDNVLRFAHGYLNVWTGIPSHGKSEFLDFILVEMAKIHKWFTVVFSPENYPLEIHFNKLAEKHYGKTIFGAGREVIDRSLSFVDEYFSFVNATEEELSLDVILQKTLKVASTTKVDCLVIDPWNEIEINRPRDKSESEYTGECLRKLRKFARKNNICVHIVAHPTKIQKDRKNPDGPYPVPSLYDISGSANWYNKADNGIVVYRDFINNLAEIHVKKVKYKQYGQIGTAKFKYDFHNGTYSEVDNNSNFGFE